MRLAYCLNLHPAEERTGVVRGLRDVTLPLAARLTGYDPLEPRAESAAETPWLGRFGIGPWFAAGFAAELAAGLGPHEEEGRPSEAASSTVAGSSSMPFAAGLAPSPASTVDGRLGREALVNLFAKYRLEPFTFNAFPHGGFHRKGLKRAVFDPPWSDPARLRFTQDVARVAVWFARTLAERAPAAHEPSHLSISTHSGGYATDDPGERVARARGLAEAARFLRRLHEKTGVRVVLGVEPEPRSHANDTRQLAALFDDIHATLDVEGDVSAKSHIGTCLDACHAAVEFEDEAEAFERATDGVPLAKLQFTSALSLRDPGDAAARRALFALHEDTFLHQVTARVRPRDAAGQADAKRSGPLGSSVPPRPTLVRADDLDHARALFDRAAAGWRDADEWRCHFHVPVDLESFRGANPDRDSQGSAQGGPTALGTTRTSADRLLAQALQAPERWGTNELHVEIETYTWNVLRAQGRKSGEPSASLDRALEQEYRHLLARLTEAGWCLAP